MATKEQKIQILDELIRTAANHLLTKNERISYLKDPLLQKHMYGKHPKCFIVVNRRDAPAINLPICNRIGIIDNDVINISYKVILKIMNDNSGTHDINDLTTVLNKLDSLKKKYSKPIPKPPGPACHKAKITRMFKRIKQHLDLVNNR